MSVVAAVLGLALVVGIGRAQSPSTTPAAKPDRADLLLVVDCLLPGQVRSLGHRTTYVSARQPARLTARDCQIRGGEYMNYDRADWTSALGAWRPLAEQGDVEAQEIVGEIFERGLGVQPDYAAAAHWYRLAAAAGSTRAMVNMGHLYERGLGVEADPRIALQWYRRAAGAEGALELDGGTPAAPQSVQTVDSSEMQQLQSRTQELESSLEKLRTELATARQALAATESRATEAELAAAQAAEAARRATVAVAATPDRSAELAALQRELALRAEEVAALGRVLEAARADQERDLRALQLSETSTAAARTAAAAEAERLRDTAALLARRETELSAQRAETERIGRELASVTAVAAARQQEIARLQPAVQERLMAGPEVVLVEPELVLTRNIVPIAVAQGTERQLVGRVTAPAGLLAITVNDAPVVPNERGVFATRLAVPAGNLPVAIVAVDRQGKRAEVKFVLRGPSPDVATPPATPVSHRTLAAGVDFGAYHALVIGNNDYQHLPDLASPINDAADLAQNLQQRYGFRTTVLRNANRYEILSALNTLRETLTPRDNLLIYFAGHGELDEVNQRGHWLPVDAEPDSTANWIPTTAITDILNIMRAKQVLLVVDSCYAGTLTRSSVGRLGTGMSDEERVHWYRTMANKRSRTVLTSGGVAPVMDAGGGRHSVFAKALLDVLDANDDAMDGQRLHREVAARVAYAAANLRFDQVPEYAPIRYAGHEAGEFFLVPKN